MVVIGMGSRKSGVVWCVGLLVVGLLLAAAEADYCSKYCHGRLDFWACVGQCRSQLEVAQLANCVPLCHGKPNFMACYNRCRYFRRAHLHLRRGGGESTTHEEEEEATVGVLTAPAPTTCEEFCRDRADWVDYLRCLDRCRFGAYVRRALLHLKLAFRGWATHEEARGGAADVLTAMAARLSDACKDFCHNHVHYEWCLRRCRFGPYLKLAGGESTTQEEEVASGGAVDVLTAAVAEVNPDICKEFCRDWPEPEHDGCLEFCLAGAYVQRAPLHLKLAGGESTTHEEEEVSGGAVDVPEAAAAQHEGAAGAQPMNTDKQCEAYCRAHARDFPAKFKACMSQCHPDVKQEGQKKDGQVQPGLSTGNIASQ